VTGAQSNVPLGRTSLSSFTGKLVGVAGWLDIGGQRVPVAANPLALDWLRSPARPVELSINDGVGRIGWDYAKYRHWPNVQPGDEMVLTLSGRQMRFRLSRVENVPANWERFALAGASADDLTIVVRAGATRLIVWAVPANRD